MIWLDALAVVGFVAAIFVGLGVISDWIDSNFP